MSTMRYLLFLTVAFLSASYASPTSPTDSSQPQPCNSCCQGPSGLPGIPGTSGTSGHNGLPGRDGLRGDKGDIGSAGLVGEKGDDGSPGLRGEGGAVGPQGTSGGKGDRGLQGLQSLPGKVGPRGLKGSDGVDGHGLPGGKGQKGELGQRGESGDRNGRSAFTVVKTNSQTGSARDVLTFQDAVTNIGNHFNVGTSRFTCQIPGAYWFTFTMCRNGNGDPIVDLVKDGTKIVRAYFHDSPNHSVLTQTTHGAVLQLAAGEQVWVQFGTNGQRVYSDTDKYTSFSGFLLYEM